MGDLLSGISPTGGGIGVFFTALFAVLAWMLRRLDTGDKEIRTGYSGLVKDLQTTSDAYRDRAIKAERKLGLEHGWRIRAEEYGRGLERLLAIEHRVWTYDDPNDDAA